MKNEVQVMDSRELAPVFSGPMALIDSAISQNAPVETLEKLMALNERHDANEAKKAYYGAMQQFQAVKPEIIKDKKGHNSKYATLSAVDRALREPLSECGLSYRFENGEKDNRFSVTCVVSHVKGHSERTTMSAPLDDSGNKNVVQGIGSTSTYLMRYTLIAAFGLTTADEDDDGQSNSDIPYNRVLQQNEHLRVIETLAAVLALKESIRDEDYLTGCSYLYSMPEETRNSIWVAPKFGGILTTAERTAIRSNEWVAASKEHFTVEDS